jgi:hypothetical protein
LLCTLCCGANSVPAINLQGTKKPEQRLVFFFFQSPPSYRRARTSSRWHLTKISRWKKSCFWMQMCSSCF